MPFVFRDFTPDNELKYVSIAREALDNGSVVAFYNHGEAYADKPPLYLWCMMGAYALLGNNLMWLMGIVSIIPLIIIMVVMGRWMASEHEDYDRRTADFMAATGGFLAAGAAVLRMDMLMAMFIVLALRTFWKLYRGTGSKADTWLLPLYIFLALFTKGPVGVLMPPLCIAVFLLLRGELRSFGRYLGWRQWALIGGLCALWFSAIYFEGGTEYLNNLLFKQTVGRGINSFHHAAPWYYYAVRLPMTFAPWSLLLAAIFIGAWLSRRGSVTARWREVDTFFTVTIAATFVMLSLFSSKIDIYLLPVYPFVFYLAAFRLTTVENKWYVKAAAAVPALVLVLLPAAAAFSGRFVDIPAAPAVWVAAVAAALCGAMALWLVRSNTREAVVAAAAGFLVLIFTGSFALPRYNEYIGWRCLARAVEETAGETGARPGVMYYKFRGGENLDVFLSGPIERCDDIEALKAMEQSQCGAPSLLLVRNKSCRREPELDTWTRSRTVRETGGCRIVLLGAAAKDDYDNVPTDNEQYDEQR